MEFIMIFVATLFVFLLMVGLITAFVDHNRTASVQNSLGILADRIQADLLLASESGAYFETELRIPSFIDGRDYSIAIDSSSTLLLNDPQNQVSVFRNIPAVVGQLNKGCNRIVKDMGVIRIAAC